MGISSVFFSHLLHRHHLQALEAKYGDGKIGHVSCCCIHSSGWFGISPLPLSLLLLFFLLLLLLLPPVSLHLLLFGMPGLASSFIAALQGGQQVMAH